MKAQWLKLVFLIVVKLILPLFSSDAELDVTNELRRHIFPAHIPKAGPDAGTYLIVDGMDSWVDCMSACCFPERSCDVALFTNRKCFHVTCARSPEDACAPKRSTSSKHNATIMVLMGGCPQQGDLRLSGPPSGQGAGGGARTRDRGVPADLRAGSLSSATDAPVVMKSRENVTLYCLPLEMNTSTLLLLLFYTMEKPLSLWNAGRCDGLRFRSEMCRDFSVMGSSSRLSLMPWPNDGLGV
ncbi:dyslexia-associated protein kiaa0319-like protein [Plakobranchus ocellatus]|uniref:Dyslexia-associated protein kiaa0319-like protein n=1 Tax=Plakobranchus ocellatus TaxID=259542 RepID=A0AAV4A140_9GAST|nr:dyslexia-associated protein kiaa0319-like protein [Plakobranchus ocellatus]